VERPLFPPKSDNGINIAFQFKNLIIRFYICIESDNHIRSEHIMSNSIKDAQTTLHKLDYTNLHEFFTERGDNNELPYNGMYENDEVISWSLEYSGGWGLGYISTYIYDKKTKMYCLDAANDALIGGEAEILEINGVKVHQISKSEYDLIKNKIKITLKESGEGIIYESDDINNIIKFGCYYGLRI
jgi:hypothetical protein